MVTPATASLAPRASRPQRGRSGGIRGRGSAAKRRAAVSRNSTSPLLLACEDVAHAEPYIAALAALGVPAERLALVTPEEPGPDAGRLAASAVGVVLCGGPDLDPHFYGEAPRADACLSIRTDLDALDWQVLTGAREGRRPLFAICRGMQSLNVFLGGSLWQDLPTQVPGAVDHRTPGPPETLAHVIEVTAPAHPEAAPLARETPRVNSRHHQAIRLLARDLVALARSPDGLLEAVAGGDTAWWRLAVQWHPENLLAIPQHRELWLRCLAACGLPAGGGSP